MAGGGGKASLKKKNVVKRKPKTKLNFVQKISNWVGSAFQSVCVCVSRVFMCWMCVCVPAVCVSHLPRMLWEIPNTVWCPPWCRRWGRMCPLDGVPCVPLSPPQRARHAPGRAAAAAAWRQRRRRHWPQQQRLWQQRRWSACGAAERRALSAPANPFFHSIALLYRVVIGYRLTWNLLWLFVFLCACCRFSFFAVFFYFVFFFYISIFCSFFILHFSLISCSRFYIDSIRLFVIELCVRCFICLTEKCVWFFVFLFSFSFFLRKRREFCKKLTKHKAELNAGICQRTGKVREGWGRGGGKRAMKK